MGVFDTLRRPEYTGENRCRPCTVVNVAIVGAVGLLVGVVSPPLAAVVVAVGLGLVALRGYVVPYTPEFAPVIADRLPVAFDHDGVVADGAGGADPQTTLADAEAAGSESDPESTGPPTGEAVQRALFEAGVLTGTDQLHLDPGFEDDWLARIRDLRRASETGLADRVADAAGFTDEAAVVDDDVQVGGPTGTTLRRPAAVTDTATVESLDAFGVDARYWQPATRPLRLFLPECPVCGGEIVETTQSECCGGAGSVYGSIEDDVLACADCDALVYRFGGDAEASDA